VHVRLVPHVPDELVLRCVEHVVHGHGQLHHTQAGTEVASGLRHAMHDFGAQLLAQLAQLGRVEVLNVDWVVHGVCGEGGREKICKLLARKGQL